ncbi:MAG TPA: hypothetical protein VMM14_03210 [Acidimicrobiia bacterium]|nr:hypothetical protein [Acidimicrobiia bacterium]
MNDRDLPGWLLPAGLAVLVAALVVVALTRGPTEFDPDTPEGAIQEYLIAINEERWDDAIEVLHEDWREGCDGSDVAGSSPGPFTATLSTNGQSSGRISDEFGEPPRPPGQSPPTLPDEVTRVEVDIRHGEGFTEQVMFELVDDGEFWWLVGDPWPHFMWNCEGRR